MGDKYISLPKAVANDSQFRTPPSPTPPSSILGLKNPPTLPWKLNEDLKNASNTLTHNLTDPSSNKAKWVLLSKRHAIMIHKTSEYRPVKSNPNDSRKFLKPIRVLMVAISGNSPNPCWFRQKFSPTFSIKYWARKVQQHFLAKSLGIASGHIQIPTWLKLVKLNRLSPISPANSFSPWRKLQSWKNLFPLTQKIPPPVPTDIVSFTNSFQPSGNYWI